MFSLSREERAGVRASNKTQFSLATRAADPDIRRLLRENPMPGSISLSLEREPNYFADANQPGEIKQTIVAYESSRVVCVGNCTTRLRFVNGKPHRVGYLGGLRLDGSVAGRFDILRRGYDFFRELQASAPADFYFTSIAAENHRARRLLERNLRGMPRYEFLGDFVTLLLPTERRSPDRHVPVATSVGIGSDTGTARRAEQLNQVNQQFQLAPHWTADQLTALHQLDLRDDDWFGAAALWDQRCFKQTAIRGYAPWLGFLRPALNLLARLTNSPRLPVVGSILSHAFVLLGASPCDLDLIRNLRNIASERGIDWLTLGFAAHDPRLKAIRQHSRCREYRSCLYLVRWPALGGAASDLDRRILAPEVALL
ncbi:MAG TPA: hypothetical protein VFZ59_05345 [Verrucomicrobiae bacterium]|nr:hypothetical protein [Verrucomicrobiae bacterium]